MKLNAKEYEVKMQKSTDAYAKELGAIRAGRANPGILDRVTVEYYGAPARVADIASVKVADARTIVIQPWEINQLKAIEKAILASDIGINPTNDGKVIRLIFPQLTEERRRDLTKQIAKLGEEAKVAIRNIRRDANEACKNLKKENEMTEDEQKASEKIVQDLTDRFCKEIDRLTAAKDKEIMEI